MHAPILIPNLMSRIDHNSPTYTSPPLCDSCLVTSHRRNPTQKTRGHWGDYWGAASQIHIYHPFLILGAKGIGRLRERDYVQHVGVS